jgi:hypothetical protein
MTHARNQETTMATVTTSDAVTHGTRGRFDGVDVRTGPGGGLASPGERAVEAATHYHAAHLPGLGDAVLAVTRVFDPATAAALRIELRAFAASAPARGTLATMDEPALLHAPGALAFARIDLSRAGDDADERRAARLVRCVVTDAAPTVVAAQGIAEWLRATWETELSFGSWPAITGTMDAFSVDGGAPADWASAWLEATEHHVDADGADDARFLKVLSPAWLTPAGEADEAAHAATDGA